MKTGFNRCALVTVAWVPPRGHEIAESDKTGKKMEARATPFTLSGVKRNEDKTSLQLKIM